MPEKFNSIWLCVHVLHSVKQQNGQLNLNMGKDHYRMTHDLGCVWYTRIRNMIPNHDFKIINMILPLYHWLGEYRTNALYSGHIFVRFNDLEDVFT